MYVYLASRARLVRVIPTPCAHEKPRINASATTACAKGAGNRVARSRRRGARRTENNAMKMNMSSSLTVADDDTPSLAAVSKVRALFRD